MQKIKYFLRGKSHIIDEILESSTPLITPKHKKHPNSFVMRIIFKIWIRNLVHNIIVSRPCINKNATKDVGIINRMDYACDGDDELAQFNASGYIR
ncbi:hypothetical protein Glove_357g23 [Diversispora epigaea]|uniref:Uncharacterized protein n=1 Tax=Diversispora epigaea TaxID=1348612 RepID=A0A397HID0_9GLOM|nr:hypothetical protein Glove_357g23 [Diversispora epigaea]